MKFGKVVLAKAVGHVLAHSLSLPDLKLKKGIVITQQHVEQLSAENIETITVASLDIGDVPENEAAAKLGAVFKKTNIDVTEPVAGRVNLVAQCNGILVLDHERIRAFNKVDESITIATLNNYARVQKGMLLATIKIIPYAVDKGMLQTAVIQISDDAFFLHGFGVGTCDIILTQTDGFKTNLLNKGEAAIVDRVLPLGLRAISTQIVKHQIDDVSKAIIQCKSNNIFILGASATSDRQDVIPSSIINVGGEIKRFGMPVDPGNLLLLAKLGSKNVIGMPGCVRSPAINGADWVLERLVAGLQIVSDDVAAMGVGGLLKEISLRPLPRTAPKLRDNRFVAIVLAAGSSRRMGSEDKLFKTINGVPLLRHTVEQICTSNISKCLVVVRQITEKHRDALKGLDIDLVEAPDAAKGMSASMRAGVLAVGPKSKGYLICLADMPDITSMHINKIVAAHNPDSGDLIIRPKSPSGQFGHPVLFDGRFYEDMTSIDGDVGAKSVISSAKESVLDIEMDEAVCVDLDTSEAWAQRELRP